MRTRMLPLSFALGALVLPWLTACGGGSEQSPPGASQAAAQSPSGQGTSTVPTTSPPPAAVDIRAVDLGATDWLYSTGGFAVPQTVTLAGGTATVDEDGFPTTYTLGEMAYGDIDGDGDEDAVARVNRAQSMGFEGLWYVWLADGPRAVQVKYPIAETGRCGTYVESVVIGNGAVDLTEYHRIPGLDDAIPCSEPGTGLRKRTITVHSEGQDTWPVQTAPVAAWGGLCPGARFNESSMGVVDLWAAPTKNAPVTVSKGPDGGAMFEQKDAPLLQRDGWRITGVKLSGMANEQGVTELECAWGQF